MLAAQPVAPVPVLTIRPELRLALRAAVERDRVARRLVGLVADEDLVERGHHLAVVEPRLGHRALLDSRAPACEVGDQVGHRLGRVAERPRRPG